MGMKFVNALLYIFIKFQCVKLVDNAAHHPVCLRGAPVPVLSYVYKRATTKKQENKIRASEVVEDIREELHNLKDGLTDYRH